MDKVRDGGGCIFSSQINKERLRPKAKHVGPLGGMSVQKSHSHETSDALMKLCPNFPLLNILNRYIFNFPHLMKTKTSLVYHH